MNYSVKIIFNRNNRATTVKNGPIEIVVYKDGKRKYYSTGVNVTINQWRNGIVVNHPDADEYNSIIRDKYDELKSFAMRKDFSIELLVKTNGKAGVCDWIEQQIRERADITESTRKQHFVMVKSLRDSGLFQTFDDLTQVNILEWEKQLRTHLSTQTSVHGYHKRLKVYITMAMRYGLLKESPYKGLSIPRGKSDSIKYITKEERQRIENLPLTGGIAIARDMFIFACYTGLAYVDLIKVNRSCLIEENGTLKIVDHRQKTKTPYHLTVLPKAREILERYNYDMNLMSNQKCNQYLKIIAGSINTRVNLSMHVGRHTFATWALSEGIPIEIVSKMLAHTDIKTTQIYAKVLQLDVAKGFEYLANLPDFT
jgi:site-specific recombinase XerD